MLTPILNALRPDTFLLINNKSRRAINYFAGTSHTQKLRDYPETNTTGWEIIQELTPLMHSFDVPNIRDQDLFDMFSHWLVAEKNFEFHAQSTASDTDLAAPFSKIFQDREEAEWAFDLLAETLQRLGVTNPDDERFSLTLRHNEQVLRLNFGNWAVLQFYGAGYSSHKVGIALIEDQVDIEEPFDRWQPFAQNQDEPQMRVFELPSETVRPLEGKLRTVYEHTFAHIAQRFEHWAASPYRKYGEPEIATAVFDAEVRSRLLSTGIRQAGIEPETNPPYPLAQCAAKTFFDEERLARWVRAIQRKGQAILYGPPGTGKTYLAEQLARHLIGGGDGFLELVQFHPAYAYEDFIQGIRPQPHSSGSLYFRQVPGRFLEFCRKARSCQGRCVLIIDEINRANLSRVFGELMYLLEYRDREIPLSGGGTFRIPANVRIIGTMNTADRSIALVDHALRRRFAFLALYPDYDVLRRYHKNADWNIAALIGILRKLNRQISNRHYEVGITFFLDKDLAQHIEDIWRMEIEPYLEEYFFDQPDKAKRFGWDQIEGEIIP